VHQGVFVIFRSLISVFFGNFFAFWQ
jgi:hypothetical protein